MKRCPTCNQLFNDSLTFCLTDGTPLVAEAPADRSASETVSSSSGYDDLAGKPTISASQFQYPAAQSYAPPPRKSRAWIWIVVIVALLLILIVGGVLAAIFIPAMMRESRVVEPRPTPVVISTPTPRATPSSDVPTDPDEVLSQLIKVEHEWTEANYKADKEALQRILADEYTGGANSQNKKHYIDTIEPDNTVKSWTFQNLKVDLAGNRATLTGNLRQTTTRGNEVYSFTDSFVWRDQRWQAVSSQASRVQ